MQTRTQHPHLAAAACKMYGVTIWLYPAEFRRAFGHELAVTFRNRVEDVLDAGGIFNWVVFAVHIAVDWMRTCGVLMMDRDGHGTMSLLGLSDGDAASGCIDRTTVDVSFVFAVAGLVLTGVGWYTFLVLLPSWFF